MKKRTLNNNQLLLMTILKNNNIKDSFFMSFSNPATESEIEQLVEWDYIYRAENSVSGYIITKEGLERLGNHAYIERNIPDYVEIETESKDFVSFNKSFDRVCSTLSDNAANALMMSFMNHVNFDKLDPRTVDRLISIIDSKVWEHDG